MEGLTLEDYLGILVRRRGAAAAAAALVFGLAVGVAFLWPPKYRSTTTIQIVQPDIPKEITESPNASRLAEAFADERIQQINEKIVASSNLVDVITKLNLYPQERQVEPIGKVVDRMKNSIKLELLSADLANPNAAGRLDPGQLAAIAFTISASYPDPLVAQEIDNELVSRFLDEDLRERREQARATSAFLGEQITALDGSLAQQEAKISQFMSQHAGERAEDLSFNMQLAAQTEAELQGVTQQLNSLNQQRAGVEQSLSTTQATAVGVSEGQVLISPSTQLKDLKAKYAIATGRYGPRHPDVIALKMQIAALEKSIGETAHSGTQEADNPAYVVLQSEARSLDGQIRELLSQQAELRRQLETYQHRVAETPGVTREYAALSRDYDNAQLRYRELKEKKMEADMNEKLEQGRKGDRLAVIDAATLPTSPYMPPRKIVLVLGLILATGSAFGGALLKDAVSGSVRSPKHLYTLIGTPPLVTIPVLLTNADRMHIRNLRLAMSAGTVVFIGLALFLYNQLVMPLDVALAIFGQRLGLL